MTFSSPVKVAIILLLVVDQVTRLAALLAGKIFPFNTLEITFLELYGHFRSAALRFLRFWHHFTFTVTLLIAS